ncbi:MAG TPA: RNA polymerase sigma-70 factor [Ktedonobacter sp.]|nr:RNA polymerase sigma-70 factor [Ktedonobacter sp.]
MEAFEPYRSYLFAIAYRMLGSTMDAEDMVQETYLRYQATPPETIISLKAYLTTIISRLCLQQLQLARRKREAYLGPWLPEPLLTTEDPELARVEEDAQVYESISLAFLILLEQLHPAERAVFLLREVFEYNYAEIAAFLGKSEVACRQLFSRARKHLGEHRPRFPASPETQKHLLTSFFQAVRSGEMAALTNLLAEDVTFWGDGGGKVPGAAMHPITGREDVAHFLLETGRAVWQSLLQEIQVELATVNGQPALITRAGSHPHSVLTIEVEAGQIRTIRLIGNPEKLTHV